MSITGAEGHGPVRVGIPISDLASGMYLAMGCLVALIERERSGRGQWVTTSLLEAQIAMLDFRRPLDDGPRGAAPGRQPPSDAASRWEPSRPPTGT